MSTDHSVPGGLRAGTRNVGYRLVHQVLLLSHTVCVCVCVNIITTEGVFE